jgi:hypothetical protein
MLLLLPPPTRLILQPPTMWIGVNDHFLWRIRQIRNTAGMRQNPTILVDNLPLSMPERRPGVVKPILWYQKISTQYMAKRDIPLFLTRYPVMSQHIVAVFAEP